MAKPTLWILLEFVLIVSLSGIVRGLDVQCGDGEWVQGHRGCYYFEMELKPYSEGKLDCQNRGGLLLSIGSVAELRYINKELKARIKDMDHLKWWVGLEADPSKPQARYMWRWADGGEFNRRVSPWGAGEPNNADNAENCVELNFKGKLNDADCSDSHPFVCEKITGTTTSDVTTASQPETSPDKLSLRTSKLPETTEQPPEETVYTSVRRRDTKGPAVRETTPNLPEAPSPETTPQPTPEIDVNEDTRASDTQPDFTTRVQTTEEVISKLLTPSKPIKEFCDPTNSDGLEWPKTPTDQVARVPCANGFATWKCQGRPAHWMDSPEISDCASPVFKSVFKDILKPQKLDEPVKKVSAKKVAKAVSSLATITKQQSLTPQEVVMTTRAISTLAMKVDLTNSSTEEIKDVVSSVVETTSNLLSKNKTSAWSELPPKDQRKSASSLLVGVETSAMAIAEVIDEVKVIKKKDENIELELVVLDPELLEEPEVVYGAEEDEDQFVLPSDMLKDDDNDGELAKIVFVKYHEIADLLQPDPEQSETEGGDDTGTVPQKLVVSSVISVSVHGKTFPHLKTPIKFTMKHTKKYPSNAVPSCVFWKFAKDSEITGSWSVEGCGVIRTNSSHTVCQCNHLTNFAVLMDVQKVEISDVHSMSLQLITYIGCIVSAICLVVSFFTFQFLKCLQGERNSIHKNLVFCLFVAELLFLFGIDKTYNKILCASMAGLMHYFFLASFTWMFLEGVHIVVMIVQVFDAAKSRLSWYYAAGYGIPLVIVGVSAGINYKGYGTENYCWLSVEDLFIWSFAGPIAVILLVNATILTYAMSTVCKHSEYVIKEKNRSDSMRAWIQGALALEVLLGLTWVFGYFYINQETIVMAYIFTVLNSLQGLFIFCFHCLLNKKVRKEYKRVLDISRVTTSTNTKSATRSSLHRKQDPSYEMYVGNSQ